MFNEKLPELLGIEQRLPEDSIEPMHQDLAAAVQKVYEEILFEVIKTKDVRIAHLCEFMPHIRLIFASNDIWKEKLAAFKDFTNG